MLSYKGDEIYVRILRETFPAPSRWYGPYESFNPRYDRVLYVQNQNERALRKFLEFASETLSISTVLDECWALSLHMSREGRSEIGQLVYDAKTYKNKPGKISAANELATCMTDRCQGHPGISRVDCVLGVPANPPKNPYNLPEVLAESISQKLGPTLRQDLVEKSRPTPEIKNLSDESKLEVLQGAYRVQGELRNESIVIVDDLVDSGTTLSIIAEQLREHGAGKVIGLAATKTWGEM